MEIKVGDQVRFDQADRIFHRDDPRYHVGIVTNIKTDKGMMVVTRADGSEWNAPPERLVKVEKKNKTQETVIAIAREKSDSGEDRYIITLSSERFIAMMESVSRAMPLIRAMVTFAKADMTRKIGKEQ